MKFLAKKKTKTKKNEILFQWNSNCAQNIHYIHLKVHTNQINKIE